MLRIGETIDPFTSTGAGTRRDPVELAFQKEPAIEVNDLFGLGNLGLDIDASRIKFKLTPTALLGLVGTGATLWFVMREIPKEKNQFFQGVGVVALAFGAWGLYHAIKQSIDKPKSLVDLHKEKAIEVVSEAEIEAEKVLEEQGKIREARKGAVS